MDMHAAQIEFVEALRDATVRGYITWTYLPDDDRNISRAEIDGEIVDIEFMQFPVSAGGTTEKLLATVSGMKTYFQVAAGTQAYEILRDLLAPQQAVESCVTGLNKATARVRRLLER